MVTGDELGVENGQFTSIPKEYISIIIHIWSMDNEERILSVIDKQGPVTKQDLYKILDPVAKDQIEMLVGQLVDKGKVVEKKGLFSLSPNAFP